MERCTGPLATEVFPLHWSLMGQQPPRVVLGKGSGKASIVAWLQKIGVSANDAQIDQLLLDVKDKSLEKKGLLTEEEFQALAQHVVLHK
jgi:isopropylmalate/homocitrate/citramalate synthase